MRPSNQPPCLPLITLLLLTACAADEPPAVQGSVSALKVGYGPRGDAFVGFDVLATDISGEALPCDSDGLDIELSVSYDGADGAFQGVHHRDVTLSCASRGGADVALVMDNSGSQRDQLDTLHDAASGLLEQVVQADGSASIVRVSTRAHVLQPQNDDLDALGGALDRMRISNGWTALYDGIRLANEQLEHHAEVEKHGDSLESFCQAARRRAIVVYTDGRDNNSADQYPCESCRTPDDGIATDVAALRRLDVAGVHTPIYTVGVGDEVEHDVLTELSRASGAWHTPLYIHEQLLSTLPRVAGFVNEPRRVCFALPQSHCGTVHLKVEFSWKAGKTRHSETRMTVAEVCTTDEAEDPIGNGRGSQ